MTDSQTEDEVSKVLIALENMEALGIINPKDKKRLITNTKSWAYDQMKLNE